MIRDATPADFPAILELNAESVHFLSALDPARLRHLHAQAAYHRVVEIDGVVAAFLLAFREDTDYDSPNYRWFARHPANSSTSIVSSSPPGSRGVDLAHGCTTTSSRSLRRAALRN